MPLAAWRTERSGGECRSRTCRTFRSCRVSTAMPCRSANSPQPYALIADIVIALAAVEAAGTQAAFFESAVRSRTGTGRCARVFRSAPCRRARRGCRAVLAFRKHNPRLRLREVSKGRQFVVVVAPHGTLLCLDTEVGQGGRIRTYDLLVPSQERCRTAPRPDIFRKLDHPAGLEPATSRSATGCSAPTELWMDSDDRSVISNQ
jgi:hypothetical protein